MNIVILTSCSLPIPAINGGAVEKLIEYYINENEICYHNKLYIFSGNEKGLIDTQKKYKYAKFYNVTVKKHSIKTFLKKIYYRIYRYIFKKRYDDIVISRIVKTIKQENIEVDCFLCENEPKYCVRLKKAFPDKKIILHLHNDKLRPKQKMYDKIINSCDRIITVSNYIKKQVNSNKCICIYNVVNEKDFFKNYSLKKINDIKKKYNIKNDEYVFIFVGRIVPEKGVEELIDSFLQLYKTNKKVKLLLIGNSFFKNSKKTRFVKKIEEKFNENIIPIGYIDNSDLINYLKSSNCIIVPSKCNEAFGLTALEGKLAGLDVIISNDGGLTEIFQKSDVQIINKNNLNDDLVKAMNYSIVNKKNDLSTFDWPNNEEYSKMINKILMEVYNEK